MPNEQKSDSPKNEQLCYADLKHIFVKKKKKILFGVGVFVFLALAYQLTRPLEFAVKGTFKEKGKADSGMGNTSKSLLFLTSGKMAGESEAVTWMSSRKLTENLVQELGLQGTVKAPYAYNTIPGRLVGNIINVYLTVMKPKKPWFPDRTQDFGFRNIVYLHEVELPLSITFDGDDSYTVFDENDQFVGRGTIGLPFAYDAHTFTIVDNHVRPLQGRSYSIALLPLTKVATDLSDKITVKLDRDDPSLINITYQHLDRHQAASVVNSLMALYQKHLRNERERVSCEQIAYLQTREKEMGDKLKNMLVNHAESLSTDLSSFGFSTTEKAIEFIAETQKDLRRKTMAIDMEVKRLKKGLDNGEHTQSAFVSDQNPQQVNDLINEIRGYRQQADVIDLALRTGKVSAEEGEELQFNYQEQLLELEETKKQKSEAKEILAFLEEGKFPVVKSALFDDPRYTLRTWHAKMEHLINQETPKDNGDKELVACFDGFTSYMQNLLHLLDVQERTVQERLKYQQASDNDFHGIGLQTARELYLTYSRDLLHLESLIAQNQHVVKEMQDPNFELCSITALLDDAVSREMVIKASQTALSLKDLNNRSSKEQERLKEEMGVQKSFLQMHLEKTQQLLKIRQNLIRQKIKDLQHVNLALIQQHISIIEKHLADYIVSRIATLNQERELIQQRQDELHQELMKLPHKWVAEKLIALEMEGNQRMVDEIAKMVESKNIGSNLEIVQSAPVDRAFAPLHPVSSKLLLYLIAGAFTGGFFTFVGTLYRTIARGLPANPENLAQKGQTVLGQWEHTISFADSLLSDRDLGILRKIVASQNTLKDPLLILLGNGQDYTEQLAHLFHLKGMRALIVPLYFEDDDAEQGLMQYLTEEGGDIPKPIHHPFYDRLPAGGFNRHAIELVSTQKFQELLTDMQKQYAVVILVSKARAVDSEGEVLFQKYRNAVITVEDETLNQLSPYFGPTTRFVFDIISSSFSS